jgi:hypothetical protein
LGIGDNQVEQRANEADADDRVKHGEETREGGGGREVAESDRGQGDDREVGLSARLQSSVRR